MTIFTCLTAAAVLATGLARRAPFRPLPTGRIQKRSISAFFPLNRARLNAKNGGRF